MDLCYIGKQLHTRDTPRTVLEMRYGIIYVVLIPPCPEINYLMGHAEDVDRVIPYTFIIVCGKRTTGGIVCTMLPTDLLCIIVKLNSDFARQVWTGSCQ